MRTRYLFLLGSILLFSDLALINGAFLISLNMERPLTWGVVTDIFVHRLLVINLMWLGAAGFFQLYHETSLRLLENLYRATWRTLALHMVGMSVYIFFTVDTQFTPKFYITVCAILSVGFLMSRFIGTVIDYNYRRRFQIRLKVAVLGFNATGIKLANYFSHNNLDYKFAGILDEKDGLLVDEFDEMHDHMIEGIRKAAQRNIRELYVSIPPHLLPNSRHLLAEAETQCIRLRIVPDLSGAMASRYQMSFLSDLPVFSLRPEPLENIQSRFKKRVFDIVFSLLVIVFVLSWLYPILALLIKLQSPGPVLFKQKRSGINNKSFWCYKFRSMRVNRDSDKRQASKNDDRITPIGRFLRSSSIDELPQFFNVLKGEMSVVGPRPHMLAHTEQYRAIISTFMVRHFLKPGITGFAQVQGYRGETKDPSQMEARVEKDIWYLEHWSLMLDIRICFLTVYLMVKGDSKAF
ncbi:MAG TPA: undecaprenyl-phosphate glucose phosphotransferase [Phnomibacter sp.]|nr:undecaprenyl-phosphate glucose phosphotransferase [Phnomibacter sp.]